MAPFRLLVHGDSFIGPLTLFHANIVKVGGKHRGASARGLSNPASTLQIAPKILDSLDTRRPKNLLLCFGNVDIQVHYLHQFATKGDLAKGSEAWADFVWSSYQAWLEENVLPVMVDCKDGCISHLFLATVLLPTVTDVHLSASFYSYTGLDAPAFPLPSYTNRALACSTFNSHLVAFANSHPNVHVVDINRHLVNEEGRIDTRHVDPNPRDLHPMWETTFPLWVQALREAAVQDDGTPVLEFDAQKHVRVDLKNLEAKYRKRGKRRA